VTANTDTSRPKVALVKKMCNYTSR